VCNIVNWHPEVENLQGKETVEATFSIAKFLILPKYQHLFKNWALNICSGQSLPKGPLQVGQQVSFGLQLEQTYTIV
jgi:hypothetical protein